MGLFFPDEPNRFPDMRPTGFERYKQLLSREWKSLLAVNFITLLFLIPFALGVAYAVLSKSLLVLVPACLVGGLIAGPGLAGMYDRILRIMRDNLDDWWFSYKKAMKQNWKASLLPGVITCLFIGILVFSGGLMWWAEGLPGFGTLALFLVSAVICTMILSVWWPQIVLFDQKPLPQLKNCLLFCLQNLWRMLLVAVIQVAWWAAMVVFLPWTAFLVPVLGVWYILFVSCHLMYERLDEAFKVEEQINQAFGQQPDTQEE